MSGCVLATNAARDVEDVWEYIASDSDNAPFQKVGIGSGNHKMREGPARLRPIVRPQAARYTFL